MGQELLPLRAANAARRAGRLQLPSPDGVWDHGKWRCRCEQPGRPREKGPARSQAKGKGGNGATRAPSQGEGANSAQSLPEVEHADLLSAQPFGASALNGEQVRLLRSLQRRYGNDHVARVLQLARDASGTGSRPRRNDLPVRGASEPGHLPVLREGTQEHAGAAAAGHGSCTPTALHRFGAERAPARHHAPQRAGGHLVSTDGREPGGARALNQTRQINLQRFAAQAFNIGGAPVNGTLSESGKYFLPGGPLQHPYIFATTAPSWCTAVGGPVHFNGSNYYQCVPQNQFLGGGRERPHHDGGLRERGISRAERDPRPSGRRLGAERAYARDLRLTSGAVRFIIPRPALRPPGPPSAAASGSRCGPGRRGCPGSTPR